MALGAEVIGRHAANEARPLPFVQQEQLRVGPYVTGVRGNEKGQIADQTHAFGAGILLQSLALSEQQELSEANLINLTCQISPGLVQSSAVPPDQLGRPLKVTGPAVHHPQRSEQGIIFQPACLLVTELLKSKLQVRSRSAAKVLPGQFKQPVFERDDGVVIDGAL